MTKQYLVKIAQTRRAMQTVTMTEQQLNDYRAMLRTSPRNDLRIISAIDLANICPEHRAYERDNCPICRTARSI